VLWAIYCHVGKSKEEKTTKETISKETSNDRNNDRQTAATSSSSISNWRQKIKQLSTGEKWQQNKMNKAQLETSFTKSSVQL